MWAALIIVLIAIAALLIGDSSGTNGGGMQLSAQQISEYAKNVGFTGNDLVYAVCIALAESSGKTDARGDVTLGPKNGPSIGLWQIDIGQREHPEYANVDLTDPQVNANAAYAIYKAAGYSFKPWSTFNNGAYANHLQSVVAAIGVPQCCGCGGCQS